MKKVLIALAGILTVAGSASADVLRTGILAEYNSHTRTLYFEDGRTFDLRNGTPVPRQLAAGQKITIFTDDDYPQEVKTLLIAPSSLR